MYQNSHFKNIFFLHPTDVTLLSGMELFLQDLREEQAEVEIFLCEHYDKVRDELKKATGPSLIICSGEVDMDGHKLKAGEFASRVKESFPGTALICFSLSVYHVNTPGDLDGFIQRTGKYFLEYSDDLEKKFSKIKNEDHLMDYPIALFITEIVNGKEKTLKEVITKDVYDGFYFSHEIIAN
jgi:hypothetical protein